MKPPNAARLVVRPAPVARHSDRLRRLLPGALMALLTLSALPGCASTIDGRTGAAVVTVTPEGTLRFNDKGVSLKDLVSELKDAGISPKDPIQVAVPRDVSPSVLKRLTQELVKAGYHRVVFTKPPESVSYSQPPDAASGKTGGAIPQTGGRSGTSSSTARPRP